MIRKMNPFKLLNIIAIAVIFPVPLYAQSLISPAGFSAQHYPVKKDIFDIYVNQQYRRTYQIVLSQLTLNQNRVPCLSPSQLIQLGLIIPKSQWPMKRVTAAGERCLPLSSITSLQWEIDGSLSPKKIELSVPNSMVRKATSIDPLKANLDEGNAMFFTNYNASHNTVYYPNQPKKTTHSSFVNMVSGFNLGLWRLRQNSSLAYQDKTGMKFIANQGYAMRAIYPIKSELLIGSSFTQGIFFPATAYDGLSLGSDDQMYSDAEQGYAPVIQGIARTNAEVMVKQEDNIIYQTTVSPGSFTISDLYPLNFTGDLQVEVHEADGQVSYFSVPCTAQAASLRTGKVRYNWVIGKTREIGIRAPFSEFVYQRGINNYLTLNQAIQWAQGYQNLSLGGVFSSIWGNVAIDSHYSRFSGKTSIENGWEGKISYSKKISNLGTSLFISNALYSHNNYFTLKNAILSLHTSTSNSDILHDKNRWQITLTQPIKEIGNFFITASQRRYWESQIKDDELQVGYNNSFNSGITLNVSLSHNIYRSSGWKKNQTATPQTLAEISISFPFGAKEYAIQNTFRGTYSNQGNHVIQHSLTGKMLTKHPINYGITTNYNVNNKATMISGTMKTTLPQVALSGTLATSTHYWQGSVSARGSILLHRNGITFGPYLADTFALIHAKGLSGNYQINGQEILLDNQGYGVFPSLNAYRYNTLKLKKDGATQMGNETSTKVIVPYAGAMLQVELSPAMRNKS